MKLTHYRRSEQVVGHVLDGSEIGRGVLGTNAALVIVEDHVQNPMQAVLNGPVTAHDRPEEVRRHHRRGDIKPRLRLGFSADLMAAFDHDDGFRVRPCVALLEPADIMYDGGGSGFDAAVIGIDGGVLTDRGVLEAIGFLFGNEELDVLAQ